MLRAMTTLVRVAGFVPLMLLGYSVVQSGEALYKTGVAYGLVDPVRFAEYRLYASSSQQFVDEIEAAIARREYSYAESLYDLGLRYGHDLPPELKERAQANWAKKAYASGTKAASGFVYGNTDSGEALVGALASDLTGVGDARDFSVQTYNYLAGKDYDPVLLGLSAAGLGLTVATYSSLGAASLPDEGVSLVKNAYRSGKLSRPLRAYFSRNAAKIVDMRVLEAEMKTAESGVGAISTLEKAAAKSIDKTAVKVMADDAGQLASMARTGGVGASFIALEIAESPKELKLLSRISSHFGKDSVPVMKFLGRTIFRIAFWSVEMVHFLLSVAGFLIYGAIRPFFRIFIRRIAAGAQWFPASQALLRILFRL